MAECKELYGTGVWHCGDDCGRFLEIQGDSDTGYIDRTGIVVQVVMLYYSILVYSGIWRVGREL